MSFSPFVRAKGKKDNYATPATLYAQLNEEFRFTHDPCPINPVGLREYDGFGDWGERNFVNPPYSNKEPWLRKALEERKKGRLSVFLLPVDTSTAWFHDLVLPHGEIRFLRGRVYFNPDQPAKFASMIVVFKPDGAGGER